MLPWKLGITSFRDNKGYKEQMSNTCITSSTYVKIVDCGLIKKEEGIEQI